MNTNTNIRSNHLYKVYFEYFSNSLKLKQNELRVKEQECKHLEKLLEAERMKTQNLMKQIEDLSNLNSQLSMQNTDAKRRLVSLELVKYDFYNLGLLIEIRKRFDFRLKTLNRILKNMLKYISN